MIPQVHFNFGPTSFDRFYQLTLPVIPGGVFTGGLLLARPDLSVALRGAFAFHPYASMVAFVFTTYVVGFLFFGFSAMLTGIVSGITQGLAFRSWTPVRASYFLSKCTIWRQVATEFLGDKLTPILPTSPPAATWIEMIKHPMKDLTERRQNDELWEEWYRVLQDYLLRDVPQVSNDVVFVWLGAQATAWAIMALCFVNLQVRHWWIYVPAALLIFFGAFFPFLTTLIYLSNERLSYWDFTARLLAEVRLRGKDTSQVKGASSDETKI
jgi:hypothetical protein